MNPGPTFTMLGAILLGVVATRWLTLDPDPQLESPPPSKPMAHDAPAPPLLKEAGRESSSVSRAQLVYTRVGQLSTAEAQRLLQSVLASEHSPARSTLLAALFEHVVERDATLAQHLFATVAPEDPAYRWVFAAWLRAWLQVDQTAAIAYARRLTDETLRDDALRLALEWLGPDTPLAQRLESELSVAARTARLGARLHRVPAMVAFDTALRHSDPESRLQLLPSALGRLLDENTAQAFLQIERIPADEREAVATLALARWAERQPDRAREYFLHADTPLAYRVAVLGALAEHDPHGALETLQQVQDAARTVELYRAVVPALLRADATLAANTVASLREQAPLDLIQQVAAEYARRDPRAVYAWAKTLAYRTEHDKLQALQAVSASVVAANPDAALAYLEQTADSDVRNGLMREIAHRKAQRDLHSAWAWLARYRHEPGHREQARALLSQWLHARPAEVAQIVLGIDDTEFQRAAAEQLALVWRERDARAFRDWVASLPPGPLRTFLLGVQVDG